MGSTRRERVECASGRLAPPAFGGATTGATPQADKPPSVASFRSRARRPIRRGDRGASREVPRPVGRRTCGLVAEANALGVWVGVRLGSVMPLGAGVAHKLFAAVAGRVCCR